MGLTPEQEKLLAYINSTEGKNLPAVQKSLLMKYATMAGDTGQPEQTPTLIPDPMKIQETFPQEAQQADKSRKAAQDKRDAEIKADIKKQTLAAESE